MQAKMLNGKVAIVSESREDETFWADPEVKAGKPLHLCTASEVLV